MTDENKFHTITSNWSDNIEKILKEMGESCLGYKWMNIHAAKKNNYKYNILMYISILIGPVSGVLSTQRETEFLQVIVTVFSFISGFISAIIKFSEFGEKAISYKTTASKYASLEGNIRRQLSLSREDRVNAGEYLEWVSTSYDDLFTASPLISDDIYQEWVKFAEKNNISVPKELGRVVEDNNNNKIAQLSTRTALDINTDEHNSHIEIVVQNKPTERNRTAVDGSNIDLTKYSDGKMRYEMNRLSRMK
jgi:hypothetical protein